MRLRYQMTVEDKLRFLDAYPHLLDDVQAIDQTLGREPQRDWNAVWRRIEALSQRGERWKAPEQKLFRGVFTQKDPDAEPVETGGRVKGYEPDPDRRDFENVPLKEDIDAYFEREVRPHVPDAWMDRDKDKLGYEIHFNRHFYRYTPPRLVEDIDTDLKRADEDLLRLRRALITRAVTCGFDSRVPLRDSGIHWLGKIPAHWKVVALRFLVDIVSGATPDTGNPDFWDGDIPWVSPKDMKRDEIDDAQDHVSTAALSGGSLRLIEPGAVLIVVRGMILAHSFPTAVTTKFVTINQDMKALRVRNVLEPRYLRDFFRGMAKHIVSLADSSAHGTRKLESDVLGRLKVCVPPLDEQREIVAHIGNTTAQLDALRFESQRTIDLIGERRSALIAAAVTGKIDMESAT